MKYRPLKMVVAGSDMRSYQIEQAAGIPLTKLIRIIHGSVKPSSQEKEKIASVLNAPVEELFPEAVEACK